MKNLVIPHTLMRQYKNPADLLEAALTLHYPNIVSNKNESDWVVFMLDEEFCMRTASMPQAGIPATRIPFTQSIIQFFADYGSNMEGIVSVTVKVPEEIEYYYKEVIRKALKDQKLCTQSYRLSDDKGVLTYECRKLLKDHSA